ncbi:MAG: diphosphate--fructose-6-phosphate 1-phosphotransferase [Chloroflexota bacterium]|nr:diphosphate--fructose-6-phosphate 1-phosphotransferase [Chloroflexota bacterium]
MSTPQLNPQSSVLSPTLLVGQSGGATAVINASLVGVVDAACASGAFARVLGMRHGIEGLLGERFVDLGAQNQTTLDRVRQTPSAALGTGRYKLKNDELDRALDLLAAHGITCFVYIGGNDSADTALRLAARAKERHQTLSVVAVPKTIDNDLPETDHCPGYGSIARFLANAVRDATYDSLASPQLYPVKFVEVMGRDAGWVPAATTLGFGPDEADLMPLVFLPERPPASADDILAAVSVQVRERGFAVAVVPETLRAADGTHLGGETPDHVDQFGHPYFPSPGLALTRLTTERLGLRARCDRPGTIARMSIALASPVDLEEAYTVGHAAVERVLAGESEVMTALVRTGDDPYRCDVTPVPLTAVANTARLLPEAFIGTDGTSLTPAFRAYAFPLLGPNPVPAYGRLR